jgi:transposase
MLVADGEGKPIGIRIESASPHEVKLAPDAIKAIQTRKKPERVIGDKAYSSKELRAHLEKQGIELIAPDKENFKVKVQDRRKLRRYKGRWKIERLNAWLQNFRRLTVRWEYKAENYLSFLNLGACLLLLRHF